MTFRRQRNRVGRRFLGGRGAADRCPAASGWSRCVPIKETRPFVRRPSVGTEIQWWFWSVTGPGSEQWRSARGHGLVRLDFFNVGCPLLVSNQARSRATCLVIKLEQTVITGTLSSTHREPTPSDCEPDPRTGRLHRCAGRPRGSRTPGAAGTASRSVRPIEAPDRGRSGEARWRWWRRRRATPSLSSSPRIRM